eukprot:TRINITY_DN7197_c0_g1_i2.p1 TRINITY_DN7197_c0_g1~~TRINITY_DN7197_c0_g1_i2.p1  ORF type:complete len:101 (-),score=7.49 TRINITY_DN7197_c0_g1_i2:112-414(-)
MWWRNNKRTRKNNAIDHCNTPPKENRLVDCPPGWKTFDKHCYKLLMKNLGDLKFDSSEQRCLDLVPDMNANIVQIDSVSQQNWIEEQIKHKRKEVDSKGR